MYIYEIMRLNANTTVNTDNEYIGCVIVWLLFLAMYQ